MTFPDARRRCWQRLGQIARVHPGLSLERLLMSTFGDDDDGEDGGGPYHHQGPDPLDK